MAIHTPSEYEQAGGHPLRRFYLRALVGVFGPLIIIGYFISIWRYYLAPVSADDPVAFGPIGAKWIFYGWFLAGVIGLKLSLYGLEGVEAGMLMERGWSVGDGMKFMMHADKTWSGPRGWMKIVKWIWQMNRKGGRMRHPSALWCILTLNSVLVFVAYPLSGLTMEMTQGYIHGEKTDARPTVTGFAYSNFNERLNEEVFSGARITWKNALEARIPGHGALYTAQDYDRSQASYLDEVPVVLPADDGMSEVFLSAQAANPIEGKAWGLMLRYNCSIVDDINDFRILKNRNASVTKFGLTGSMAYLANDGTATISVKNQTAVRERASNIDAVIELGYEEWPSRAVMQQLMKEDLKVSSTLNTGCYYNKRPNITGDYPNIDQEQVFEAMLWQNLGKLSYGGQKPNYNLTLNHNITGAHEAYDYRKISAIQIANAAAQNSSTLPPVPMSAIGVQCKASSSVGTADISGVQSTWSNFERTDTPINVQRGRCASRFSGMTPMWLMNDIKEKDWMSNFFSSVAAPPPFYQSFSTDPSDIDVGSGALVQLNYLQAEELRESMLRAYAAYAVKLMYNGGQDFTSEDGSYVAFQNPNVTGLVASTVITRGVIRAEIPIALFGVWAVAGSLLGLVYGFRRRWSATLDGYTMFRLGADLPSDLKRKSMDQSITLDVDKCRGLVGDMKPEIYLGRIGLVEESGVAVKGKLYE
jgi:hypothetical protein